MPLTPYRLRIDQTRAGWGERAAREAAELLRAAGLSSMAAEMGRAEAAPESLATLGHYLRLELLPGRAPARMPTAHAHGGLTRTGFYPGPAPARVRLAWHHQTPAATHRPAVCLDGRVFLGDDDGRMHCLCLEDGKELWSAYLGGWVRTAAAATAGCVLFGNDDGELLCAGFEDGQEIWRLEGKVRLRTNPAIAGQRVLVGALDGTLTCLCLQSGCTLWQRAWPDASPGTAAVNGQQVVFFDGRGSLRCLDLESGQDFWSKKVGKVGRQVPALTDGRVVFVSKEQEPGQICCVALEDGAELWNYTTASHLPALATDGRRVLVTQSEATPMALDIESGRRLWGEHHDAEAWSGPTIAGDHFFSARNDEIYCGEMASGRILWRYETGTAVRPAPVTVEGERILFVSFASGLHCLEADPEGLLPK